MMSDEDLIQYYHQSYKLMHPKYLDVGHEHYWHILRKVLGWVELHNDSTKTFKSLKWKVFANILGAPKNYAIKSNVEERSYLGTQTNQQVNTSLHQHLLDVKKTNK